MPQKKELPNRHFYVAHPFIKLGTGPKAAVRYTLKDVEDYIAHNRHTSAVRAFVAEELDDRL